MSTPTKASRTTAASSTKKGAATAGAGAKGSSGPGKDAGERKRSTPLMLGVSLVALLMAAPLIFMLSTSLKSNNEMANRTLSLIPRSPTLENFTEIIGAPATPVERWFINSMVAATLHTILVLIVASMAAYALARLDFPGKKFLTAIIVPGAAGAFGVFFLRQFFLSLPMELEEAALLDGANRWTIFTRLVVPLSGGPLATLALLSFLTNWNDFLWPLYVLFSPERLTLQPGLSTLNGAFATDYATIMAGGVIASIPVLILFAISQRFVIEGVARSGVKG